MWSRPWHVRTRSSPKSLLIKPRNALAKNFWLVESYPRYLRPGTHGLGFYWIYMCPSSCMPCTYIHFARSPQQADEIYSSGMTFLRAHRLLTIISQRRIYGFLTHGSSCFTRATVAVAGATCFFGIACLSSMLFGCVCVAVVCKHARMCVCMLTWLLRPFTISY